VKLRTWHIEGLVVAGSLAGALFAFGKAGDWREWVAALGVQLGFHHASVANRLQEAEEGRVWQQLKAGGIGDYVAHVQCVGWLSRYWVLKEIAWVAYFLSTGAVSALVGCGVFLVHPFWRRWYRGRFPRGRTALAAARQQHHACMKCAANLSERALAFGTSCWRCGRYIEPAQRPAAGQRR
jgi:hypothetical protein